MFTPLRVSELGLCARRVAFAHVPDAVPEVSPESHRVMALGHLIEKLRRMELRAEGRRVFSPQAEVRFGPATGHIDGFLKVNGETVLWEAKSTTGFSLTKWHKEGLPRRIGWQIHGYMVGLSERLGEPVTKTLLETVDRTNGEVFSWTYDRDDAITHEALKRADFLADCLDKGSTPDREFEATSSECAFCPFRATCRPNSTPSGATQDVLDAGGWVGFLEAMELYIAGQQLKEEGEQLASKAKDTILDGLVHHGATRASAKGYTAVWSEVTTSRLDAKDLQKAHPEIHAQFVKPSTYTRLEVRH